MKIVFIGNSNISLSFLKLINNFNFHLTVFIPYAYKKKFTDDSINLEPYLKKNKINFIKFKKFNSIKKFKIIKKIQPEYIFSLGSSIIINKKILNIPKNGSLGFHPTQLPFNKGNHPLIWTIILGLKMSATSFFYLNEKIDDGKIVSQKKFYIPKNITSSRLYSLVTKNALTQLKQILNHISLNKKLNSYKQILKKSNYWRKRKFKDGIIDWKMSYELIDRHIRALSNPYSGAEFYFKNRRIKIHKIKKIKKNYHYEPGKILAINNNYTFDIACYDYEIRVLKYKPLINLKSIKYL